jgi:transcriptional regulator with XRE-family HTH domain
VSLLRAVEDGTFRADLYHRLNGITIELAPLRERDRDVELLARHFAAIYGRQYGKRDLDFTPDALQRLRQYTWPGNVREPQRVMSVATVLATGSVTADDLPQQVRSARPPAGAHAAFDEPHGDATFVPPPLHGPINLREIKEWAGRQAQKMVILELQKRTNITRQELARMVGVDPKTLRSRMKEGPQPTPSRLKGTSRGTGRPLRAAGGFAEPPHHADHFRKAHRLVERRRGVELVDPFGFDARQDHDRNVGDSRILLLLVTERPAVHHRHAEVEQNHAGVAALAQIVERFLAVAGGHRGKAFQLQELAHQPDEVRIVVDDEDAGGHAPPLRDRV